MTPFDRDYSAHQIDNIRVQWTLPIREVSDLELFIELLKNVGGQDESLGMTSYLGIMDIISHGNPEFLIEAMQTGGASAIRKIFAGADLLHDGWNGLGAGLNIMEAMVRIREEFRSRLLKNWSFMLRPLREQFALLDKISAFPEFTPILSYQNCKNPAYNVTDKDTTDTQNRLREYCNRLRAHIRGDPRKLMGGEEGILFSDYLRRLEAIVLSAQDRTLSTVQSIFRAHKLLEPTHLTVAEAPSSLPQLKSDEVQGPKLESISGCHNQKYKSRTNLGFIGNVAVLANRNLQSILYFEANDISIYVMEKAKKKEKLQNLDQNQTCEEEPSKTNSLSPTLSDGSQPMAMILRNEEDVIPVIRQIFTQISTEYPDLIPADMLKKVLWSCYSHANQPISCDSECNTIKTMSVQPALPAGCESPNRRNSSNLDKLGYNANYKSIPSRSTLTQTESSTNEDVPKAGYNANKPTSIDSLSHDICVHHSSSGDIRNTISQRLLTSTVTERLPVGKMFSFSSKEIYKGSQAPLRRQRLLKTTAKLVESDSEIDVAPRPKPRLRSLKRDSKTVKVDILLRKRNRSCSRDLPPGSCESSSSTVNCF